MFRDICAYVISIEYRVLSGSDPYSLSLFLALFILESWTNSEDPDEMSHKATFHQGLHCLLR